MKIILTSLAMTACLAGCAIPTSQPVRGQLQNQQETFTGVATGDGSGAGMLTVVTSRGAKCEGRFVFVTARQGEGVFTCSDGRSGPFDFVSAGGRGTGRGRLNNETFIFTFGDF